MTTSYDYCQSSCSTAVSTVCEDVEGRRRRSWDSQMGIQKSADGAQLSSKPQLHLERGRTLGLLGYVSRDKVISSKVEKLDEGRWLIVDFEQV